jgi:hypothetical protein
MQPAAIPYNRRFLEETLRALHSRGIQVLLVSSPVYRTYRAGMRPESYEKMQQTVRGLSATYGVPYLNFMDTMSAGDFYDCDHLNAAGTAKYTALLRAELQNRLGLVPEAD